MLKKVTALCCIFAVITQAAICGNLSGDAKKISSAGMKYVASHQNNDGSYGNNGDIVNSTAIVLYAFAAGSRKYKYNNGPFVSRAVNFLLTKQKKDGSFGSYEATSNAALALKVIGEKEYASQIAKAITYLNSYNITGGYWDFFGLKIKGKTEPLLADCQKAFDTKSLALAQQTIKMILSQQVRDNPAPTAFGEVKGLKAEGIPNTVVASALCSLGADMLTKESGNLK